jgi:DoxX-like protein
LSNSRDFIRPIDEKLERRRSVMNKILWTLQILLGLFFALASGAPKLLLPIESLPMPIPIPEPMLKLIGVAEVLGGLGLILPGLTHIKPGLTPLAAACLVLLTVCATIYQLMSGQPESAIFAAVIGLLCAFVAYGRWRLVPLQGRASTGATANRTAMSN